MLLVRWNKYKRVNEGNTQGFIRLSKRIITIATHPMYDTIVAGAEVCELKISITYLGPPNLLSS
ncbi:unnamed protein product [Trifolium pratense]|uniref:Uncharacterized protein n=1 Tax=Trifolium pratense TaxID=57577 RepID=A0ACB0J2F9_TRIPR|nr:unnamed protein product [Trifolium pratense]